MAKTTAGERLAVLESVVGAHDQRDREHFEQLAQAVSRINDRLDSIDAKLSKQKGFLGGVVFVVSALWALALAAMKFLPIRP